MRIVFAFFAVLINHFTFGQRLASTANNLIEWNEYYTLTWEDFKGQPSGNSFGDAGTAVQIKAVPFFVKGQVMYDVHTYFNRDKSWTKGKSASLLKHEQIHFDIAELYARMIRKKISDMTEAGVKNVSEFNQAINELLIKSNEADQRYDLETLHGALQKKQAFWERYVNMQLQGLKDYKKQKRLIANDKLKRHSLFFLG
jgi:hypothetical protein